MAKSDDTRRAGRGLVAIAGAKVWFIVTGFAIKLALPRLLGSPEEFGLFETAMSAVSMLNMVLIAATIQSVAKFVSEDETRAPALLRQGLRNQLLLGGVLGATVFLGAPYVAAFLRDEALTPLLRTAAGVVVAYALYAAIVGALNGRQRFTTQASLDATFSAFRTTGIVGGAALGLGALGALGGFAAAAAVIMVVALFVVRRDLFAKSEGGASWRRWVAFMAPIWLYQAFLNGCLQIDVQVLKKTIAELALAAGDDPLAAAARASTQVGFYRAAQTFAFVPYQVILAMTFVVFPMVSKATTLGDEEAARTTIRGALRFSLLVLLALAAPIAGAADGVLRIAYPEEYLVGAPALGVLVFGMVAFALFVIAATILSGAGQPALAAGIAALALAVVVGAGRALVLATGPGTDALPALAWGTTAGTTLALLLAGAAVYRRFGAFLPWKTVVRAAIAGAAGILVARYVPHATAVGALLALVAGGLTYVATLALVGELGKKDLEVVRRLRR